MISNLTPYHLSSLNLSTVTEASRYNIRNSNDIRTINARTSQNFNSFLPSAIKEWNSHPEEHINSSSVTTFKYQLNQPISFIPKFYYVGERQIQILHTRLWTECRKKGLEKSPGSVTITNCSPSQTPRGKGNDKSKQAQIEQTYEKPKISSLFPKRGNRNAKRTEKHKDKMTQGKK